MAQERSSAMESPIWEAQNNPNPDIEIQKTQVPFLVLQEHDAALSPLRPSTEGPRAIMHAETELASLQALEDIRREIAWTQASMRRGSNDTDSNANDFRVLEDSEASEKDLGRVVHLPSRDQILTALEKIVPYQYNRQLKKTFEKLIDLIADHMMTPTEFVTAWQEAISSPNEDGDNLTQYDQNLLNEIWDEVVKWELKLTMKWCLAVDKIIENVKRNRETEDPYQYGGPFWHYIDPNSGVADIPPVREEEIEAASLKQITMPALDEMLAILRIDGIVPVYGGSGPGTNGVAGKLTELIAGQTITPSEFFQSYLEAIAHPNLHERRPIEPDIIMLKYLLRVNEVSTAWSHAVIKLFEREIT